MADRCELPALFKGLNELPNKNTLRCLLEKITVYPVIVSDYLNKESG